MLALRGWGFLCFFILRAPNSTTLRKCSVNGYSMSDWFRSWSKSMKTSNFDLWYILDGKQYVSISIKNIFLLPNSFYEATVTVILKPHKDSERKENYRPLLLWKLMQKYWIKYLQTASKNPSKIIIHHDQVSFNSEIQGWINIQNSINAIFYINKLTEKKHMIILIRQWKKPLI